MIDKSRNTMKSNQLRQIADLKTYCLVQSLLLQKKNLEDYTAAILKFQYLYIKIFLCC